VVVIAIRGAGDVCARVVDALGFEGAFDEKRDLAKGSELRLFEA